MTTDQRRTALNAIAIWAVVSLVDAVTLRVDAGGSLLRALYFRGIDYGVLGLFGVIVWFLGRRWSRAAWPRWRFVAAHVVLALVIIPSWQLGNAVVLYLCGGGAAVSNMLGQQLWTWLQAALLYALMVSSILYIQTAGRLRRQAARAAHLQLLAREAEVRALRAQLRPHFLFNVLNSIYSFIGSSPEKAERMVALLADLLRDTLELGDQDWVTLDEELTVARRYLAIESIRLGDRLTIDIRVANDVRTALLPPFLLQPVIENAVQHGIAPSAGPGRLAIEARGREGGATLEILIRDTGPGPHVEAEHAAFEEGRGLAITRGRLDAVYDNDAAGLTIGSDGDQGCCVVLRVPIRRPVDQKVAR